jgi:MFS family permease
VALAGGAPQRASMGEVWSYFRQNFALYATHATALGMLAMAGYAVGAWLPEALSRAFPVTPFQVAEVTGTSALFINVSGMIVAGIICDRLTRRGHSDAPLLIGMASAIGIAILSCIPPIMPTVMSMWIALVLSGFTFHAYNGVGPMAVNQITPNQYRAQMSAFYLFVVNLLGLGVGPALVPYINDHLFHDPKTLRYSLMMVVFGASSLAALLLWLERPLYRAKQREAAGWQ